MNYGSLAGFFAEVSRVLRPGGLFGFADQCGEHERADLRAALEGSGLEITAERDFTPRVVEALGVAEEATDALLRRTFPLVLRPLVRQFAALPGSFVYERFRTGTLRYVSYVARKSALRPAP